MKLLMFACLEFWCKSTIKTVEKEADDFREVSAKEAIAAFVQFEEHDGERPGPTVTKLIKNIKWLAGKFGWKKVVLHSFNHLSESSLDYDQAKELLFAARDRLANVGYETEVTPYGHVCELKMHVSGRTLGRVFKSV